MLRAACHALTRDRTGSITRVQVTGSYSHEPGGVLQLIRLAEADGAEHGLKAYFRLRRDTLTVTFERRRLSS